MIGESFTNSINKLMPCCFKHLVGKRLVCHASKLGFQYPSIIWQRWIEQFFKRPFAAEQTEVFHEFPVNLALLCQMAAR